MNAVQWLKRWYQRRRVRRELLATPGVDLLVVRVMDSRYGKHGWRVKDGMLEAEVQTHGQGEPWWGLIGPLRGAHTRAWLREGGRPPQLSHAKVPPGVFGYYEQNFADTQPMDAESAQVRAHNEGKQP